MKTKRQPVKASRPRKKIGRASAAAVVSTILVPVDFSIQSSKALHYACTLAMAFGARLQLLT
ncbi:MAG: universal stress protein [Chthoniobacterales bacterium]|nr:universal stress protein [Chthoniobacterales bacterium]